MTVSTLSILFSDKDCIAGERNPAKFTFVTVSKFAGKSSLDAIDDVNRCGHWYGEITLESVRIISRVIVSYGKHPSMKQLPLPNVTRHRLMLLSTSTETEASESDVIVMMASSGSGFELVLNAGM